MSDEIENLRATNKGLRAVLLQQVHEKRVLEDVIARQSAYILELRRRTGLAPHDYEPAARPGLSEVD